MEIKEFDIMNDVSELIGISKDMLVKEGIKLLLVNKLREIKAEIFKIKKKYNIDSIEDFETLYKEGKLEEKDSFEDYIKLDRLEFYEENIEKLLNKLK